MDRAEWRAFAEQTKTEQGAIVATQTIVSRSLIDDTDPSIPKLIAHLAESAARDFYDRDDCEYTYLTPDEYPYDPGPHTDFSIPEDSAVLMGRVRVRRIPS